MTCLGDARPDEAGRVRAMQGLQSAATTDGRRAGSTPARWSEARPREAMPGEAMHDLPGLDLPRVTMVTGAASGGIPGRCSNARLDRPGPVGACHGGAWPGWAPLGKRSASLASDGLCSGSNPERRSVSGPGTAGLSGPRHGVTCRAHPRDSDGCQCTDDRSAGLTPARCAKGVPRPSLTGRVQSRRDESSLGQASQGLQLGANAPDGSVSEFDPRMARYGTARPGALRQGETRPVGGWVSRGESGQGKGRRWSPNASDGRSLVRIQTDAPAAQTERGMARLGDAMPGKSPQGTQPVSMHAMVALEFDSRGVLLFSVRQSRAHPDQARPGMPGWGGARYPKGRNWRHLHRRSSERFDSVRVHYDRSRLVKAGLCLARRGPPGRDVTCHPKGRNGGVFQHQESE